MAFKTNHPSAFAAGIIVRCTPLLFLLVPLIVSISLICSDHIVAYGSAHLYITTHRTTVSIFVQLLSSVMGALQITTLTTIINHALRLRLTNAYMRLDTVRLFTALSVPRVSWTLPPGALCLAVSMVIITQGPGALWAGAITPVTARGVQQIGSIAVPRFTAASRHVWDSEFELKDDGNLCNHVKNCNATQGELTYVTSCPVPNQQKALLEATRTASSSLNALRNNTKPDSQTWTYQGRSYGLGSAQGLREVVNVPADYNLLGYTYNETGYDASVRCMHNASADLRLTYDDSVNDVHVWYIEGKLPNSQANGNYPVIDWYSKTPDTATLLGWTAFSNPKDGPSHMVGIVASATYDDFNNVQCDITFTPKIFSVNVNATTRSIVASPLTDANGPGPDPTGHLQSNSVYSLNLLARMSTSLYTSILGDALAYNLNTLQAEAGEDNTTAVSRSVEESFMAVLDSVLGIYGGAQLVLANDTMLVPIDGVYKATRFGQKFYKWAVLGVNCILLVVLLAEVIRTRGWRGLPQFDPLDFKSVVATASFGGDVIAARLKQLHQQSGGVSASNRVWFGDSGDRKLGDIEVHLEQGPANIAIVNSGNDAQGEALEELLAKDRPTQRIEEY
ncbi:hypothetical protein BKA58DRAFT_425008 [Alternaria rosae]|uniref:uncharacterized protein n=1 Tax=Alternaria rosae TaxID=1187941 RepID=UPI001E8E8E9E|nr:uncharacterized protein BKA58DRAFT_425008 [Alternaria rosae]KAH6851463.1 hypothetical protein BKA58DRAFT_425008 [Alternaria rosae]